MWCTDHCYIFFDPFTITFILNQWHQFHAPKMITWIVMDVSYGETVDLCKRTVCSTTSWGKNCWSEYHTFQRQCCRARVLQSQSRRFISSLAACCFELQPLLLLILLCASWWESVGRAAVLGQDLVAVLEAQTHDLARPTYPENWACSLNKHSWLRSCAPSNQLLILLLILLAHRSCLQVYLTACQKEYWLRTLSIGCQLDVNWMSIGFQLDVNRISITFSLVLSGALNFFCFFMNYKPPASSDCQYSQISILGNLGLVKYINTHRQEQITCDVCGSSVSRHSS